MKRPNLIDKAFLLKRTPLFSTLDLDLLLSIADKLSSVDYDPGDYVFLLKEEANRMYFIFKGQVEIRLTPSKPFFTLKNGDFFGEESLFSNLPRSYEALCPIDTHLLTLSRTNLYSIISECPAVALGFLQIYTSAMQFRPTKQIGDNI